LIARALDNEEGNIVEHRDYLKMEEEKRKRARVIRPTIDGPLVRWVSKTELAKIPTEPPPSSGGALGSHLPINVTQTPYPFANASPHRRPPQADHSPVLPGTTTIEASSVISIPPAPPPVARTEKLSKNYVIHELGQFDAVPQPGWEDTMEAMFGDHVQWEELRVYVGKSRPLGFLQICLRIHCADLVPTARPKQFCPITGRLARYRDPRTRVPYSDVAAYKTITKVLAYEYVWSEALGCYISHQDTTNASGLI
jgi:hypothetical protein